MDADVRTQLAFHVLGRSTVGTRPADSVGRLRPALLAAYADPTRLRHDYPLVLVRDAAPADVVQTLTGLVDSALKAVAPRGPQGEKMRRQALRIEREIRARSAAGGLLSAVWDDVVAALAATDPSFAETGAAVRAAIRVDGALLACTAQTPLTIVRHLWRLEQERKLAGLAERVEGIILKLTDILAADLARSEAGRAPDALAAAVGPGFSALFDFSTMSELLGSVSASGPVSKRRRRRIEQALAVLEAQPLLRALRSRDRVAEEQALATLVVTDCATALAAWEARRPDLVALVRAIAIAELEIDGRYREEEHDPFFEAYSEAALGPSDLALGPDLLVCVEDAGALRRAEVLELLAAGVPAKVVVLTGDVIGDPGVQHGAPTLAGTRLATMATGLDDVFVLQTTVAALGRCGARLARGLAYAGPTLISIYTGAGRDGGRDGADPVAPYLRAAAATQARVFPSFTYDPSAGPGLAERWDVADNPRPDADWSVHPFRCEDAKQQRIVGEIAFTAADLIAGDPRHAHLFGLVESAHWNDAMVPVDVWIAGPPQPVGAVPYVPVVDDQNRLWRAVASEPVIAATRRAREAWHRLQELGDIHNSWAERRAQAERLAREQAEREAAEAVGEDVAAAPPSPAPVGTVAAVSAAKAEPKAAAKEAATPAPEPASAPSGEAYIETPRCTSCNACLQVNTRLFVYDGNKQATIGDLSAGTYRQLVEAAESCPVGIIHPGEPQNPSEPDLDDLRKRAAAFG
ncbi:ferredoxin [Rhodoplanes azumiensis]|uniref:Ferredoxin n=1 Tax=Rhodoplanes azumiensis TaxID=1897628 RepID=A0ABW5AJ93_9BRAD